MGLSVTGHDIGPGLPARVISLAELRTLLLKSGTSYATRDAALAVLLRRAQTGDHDDLIGLVGMLLPGLARAAPQVRACPELRQDVELEILTRLVALIPTVSAGQDKLAARLVWEAARAGHRLARADRAHRDYDELSEEWVAPSTPQPHPDFVLDTAVAERVVTRQEADLIGQTRLNGLSVKQVAGSRSAYARLRKRRVSAERRLVAWLLTSRSSQNHARKAV